MAYGVSNRTIPQYSDTDGDPSVNFQPGTIDHSQDGSISADGDDLSLTLPAVQGQSGDHYYKGSRQALKDVDCVLLYDDETDSYVLERLASMTRFEHQRGKGRALDSVSSSKRSKEDGGLESVAGSPLPSQEPHHASPRPKAKNPSQPATPVLGNESDVESGSLHFKKAAGSNAKDRRPASTGAKVAPPPRMPAMAPTSTPGTGKRKRPIVEDLDLSPPASPAPDNFVVEKPPPVKRKASATSTATTTSTTGSGRTTRRSVTKATTTLPAQAAPVARAPPKVSQATSSSTMKKSRDATPASVVQATGKRPAVTVSAPPPPSTSTKANHEEDDDDEEDDPDLDEFANMLESTLGAADVGPALGGATGSRPSSSRRVSAGAHTQAADESSEDED